MDFGLQLEVDIVLEDREIEEVHCCRTMAGGDLDARIELVVKIKELDSMFLTAGDEQKIVNVAQEEDGLELKRRQQSRFQMNEKDDCIRRSGGSAHGCTKDLMEDPAVELGVGEAKHNVHESTKSVGQWIVVLAKDGAESIQTSIVRDVGIQRTDIGGCEMAVLSKVGSIEQGGKRLGVLEHLRKVLEMGVNEVVKFIGNPTASVRCDPTHRRNQGP